MLTVPAIFALFVFACVAAAVALDATFRHAAARTSLDLRMSYIIAGHKDAALCRRSWK